MNIQVKYFFLKKFNTKEHNIQRFYIYIKKWLTGMTPLPTTLCIFLRQWNLLPFLNS